MSKRLQDAISALADLYEYGHLMASATPADFLMQVAQEIVSLRAESADPADDLHTQLLAARERIEALESELASYREEEAIDEIAYAEYRAAQHRIAEALGFSASWHLDIEFLTRIEGAVAALRARCERRDGDPTVEQVRLLADEAWVTPHDAISDCYMRVARALLRAWGEEP